MARAVITGNFIRQMPVSTPGIVAALDAVLTRAACRCRGSFTLTGCCVVPEAEA